MRFRIRLVTLCLIGFLAITAAGQNSYDSLLSTRKTNRLEGRVPTIYSPGSRAQAQVFASTYQAAITYYEKLYPIHFSLQLAVLDSAQWVKEVFPYGYLMYDSGWAMLPAGMTYDFILRLYGIADQRQALDSFLLAKHIATTALIQAVFSRFFTA